MGFTYVYTIVIVKGFSEELINIEECLLVSIT
jgi:hypothetical protein